jgi:hypothetical protein
VSPLTFAGAGWFVVVLGLSGPLGVLLGTVGVAIALVGVSRIRWRNQVLVRTFWATVALLGALLVLIAGVPPLLGFVLLLSALQTGVGVGLATGVRDCLLAGGPGAEAQADRLHLVRILVVVTYLLTAGATVAFAAGAAVPEVWLVLLFYVTLAVNLWLGVLLLQVRHHPSLQEHATGR